MDCSDRCVFPPKWQGVLQNAYFSMTWIFCALGDKGEKIALEHKSQQRIMTVILCRSSGFSTWIFLITASGSTNSGLRNVFEWGPPQPSVYSPDGIREGRRVDDNLSIFLTNHLAPFFWLFILLLLIYPRTEIKLAKILGTSVDNLRQISCEQKLDKLEFMSEKKAPDQKTGNHLFNATNKDAKNDLPLKNKLVTKLLQEVMLKVEIKKEIVYLRKTFC